MIKKFDIAIDGCEQELFKNLILSATNESEEPDYDSLPINLRKLISKTEFKYLVEKLFHTEAPVPRFTKMFMLVDYINAFTTGSLGSEDARNIESNILDRLRSALDDKSTAVVVLIDAHYNDEAYLKSREGKHLPVLHANTDEERMLYGSVHDEMKKYYNEESESYETNEEDGVYFIYKSGFGSLNAPDIMNECQSRFSNRLLNFMYDFMDSKAIRRLESIYGDEVTYSWSGPFDAISRNLAMMESDIEEIEIAGVATNVCVLSNAILCQSMLPQAEIYIHTDCVASYDNELHNMALCVMRGLGINII